MEDYLKNVSQKFADSQTSEMGYRTDFENLLRGFFSKEQKYHIHHDAKAVGGNKPDFVLLKGSVPVLYIEVKDIGINLDKVEKSNQMERYFGYGNLILTDYLEFRFYRNGIRYGESIKIAQPDSVLRIIKELPGNFSLLEKTIIDFSLSHKEKIKRGKHLAQIMGGKAQRIRDNVKEMLASTSERYADLLKMRDVVKEHLVSSLDDESFADMYAQTLVYGLFAARYNDKTPKDFSRTEARELVPKTNPFLRSFFDHIAGTSFPERLRFIVDELCEVFTHADVHELMHEYFTQGKLTGGAYTSPDPVIHFYEDFLLEYDAKKKMEMGVFYTPRPVVQFIVRAVDDILKTEFGLEKGLTDTAKISIEKMEVNEKGKEIKVKKEYHKVQVLDVATGTGTFLNEVIKFIHTSFKGQEGRWPAYVQDDLLPRLHGFELMMASYTIAHLKLGMTLHDSGAEKIDTRLGVYLTNTLDEPIDFTNQNTLFGIMDSIAQESKNASRIKKEYPIMCVIGNPPYSGISMNKHYTDNCVYKVEPGGLQKLQERKNWLDDDYVKFIRFAESLIEKNGEGIVGMITAHGYIDNPTFRGMRWHLRKTFDKIYVIDLHGNGNKKEVSLDGSKDQNIFDILSGVSIILGVKKSDEKERLATVYTFDAFGTRSSKFEFLDSSNMQNINWIKLPYECEVWRIEGEGKNEYLNGLSLADLFPKNTTGIVTGIDRLSIFQSKDELKKVTKSILDSHDPYGEFDIKDGRKYKKEERLSELRIVAENPPTTISYRPFDERYLYYTKKSECWINSPRSEIMGQYVDRENIGLLITKSVRDPMYNHIFVTKNISEVIFLSGTTATNAINTPLYIYSELEEKIPNLSKEIWKKINEVAGETTPENILDYVYASLHSPNYRKKYTEFLKTDFPRVPYPKNKEEFWKLVPLGKKLRELHLMVAPECNNLTTTYIQSGDNLVEKIKYEKGNVQINPTQYFGNVPDAAWNFYIGGYQPAQKWLKDRKGMILSNGDIEYYQKMIFSLVETSKIMAEIDKIYG